MNVFETPPPDAALESPAAGTPLRELATEAPAAAEQTLPGRRAEITLAGPDGTPLEPFTVRIDNRDYLRWDKTAPKQKWPSGRDAPFLMATFLAFSAAARAGQTTLSWAQWEAACLECREISEADEDLARPTR